MSTINVPKTSAALTGNGTTAGYVTVADNSAFYVGAIVNLSSDTQDGVRGIITELVSSTGVGIRLDGTIGYGRSDLSDYTTADNAILWQNASQVSVANSNDIPLPSEDNIGDVLTVADNNPLEFEWAAGGGGGGTTQTIDVLNATAATGKQLTSAVANSGTNVGFIFNNSTTLSGTTLLASFRNNGVEKFSVADDGSLAIQGTISGTYTIGGTPTLGATLTSATAPQLASSVADGATAVGAIFNHTNAFTTQGARDVSFRSAGTEYLNFYNDGSNVLVNVPVNEGLWLQQRVTMADGTVVGSQIKLSTTQIDINPGANAATTQYRITQTALYPQNASKSLGGSGVIWTETWSRVYATEKGGDLASAATIAPTRGIHHVTGTAQITTITVPTMTEDPSAGVFVGTIILIPDGAFTYASSGNIVGTGLAVVGKAMHATFDGTSWYMSY